MQPTEFRQDSKRWQDLKQYHQITKIIRDNPNKLIAYLDIIALAINSAK